VCEGAAVAVALCGDHVSTNCKDVRNSTARMPLRLLSARNRAGGHRQTIGAMNVNEKEWPEVCAAFVVVIFANLWQVGDWRRPV
jgi:hypothetical protein